MCDYYWFLVTCNCLRTSIYSQFMYIKKYAVSDFTIFQFLLENTEQKWGHLSKTVRIVELTNAMEQSPS